MAGGPRSAVESYCPSKSLKIKKPEATRLGLTPLFDRLSQNPPNVHPGQRPDSVAYWHHTEPAPRP